MILDLNEYLHKHCAGSKATFARKFDLWPQNVNRIFNERDEYMVKTLKDKGRLLKKTPEKHEYVVINQSPYKVIAEY